MLYNSVKISNNSIIEIYTITKETMIFQAWNSYVDMFSLVLVCIVYIPHFQGVY